MATGVPRKRFDVLRSMLHGLVRFEHACSFGNCRTTARADKRLAYLEELSPSAKFDQGLPRGGTDQSGHL